MNELPPVTTTDIVQILDNMSDEDRQHLAEIVMIRMSAELYRYVVEQSLQEKVPFGEWIRRACISYGHHREVIRNSKRKNNEQKSGRNGIKKEKKSGQAD